jgi:hypothetical protein
MNWRRWYLWALAITLLTGRSSAGRALARVRHHGRAHRHHPEEIQLESPRLPTLGVAQSRVFNSMARYIVLVAGRRFGKSTLEAVRLFKKAYTKPDSINWYIAPTYSQAKTIFWDILKDTVPRMYVLKKNESELTIILKNRSKIALKGADNPDSLRGPATGSRQLR